MMEAAQSARTTNLGWERLRAPAWVEVSAIRMVWATVEGSVKGWGQLLVQRLVPVRVETMGPTTAE